MIKSSQWINLPGGRNLNDHVNVRLPTPRPKFSPANKDADRYCDQAPMSRSMTSMQHTRTQSLPTKMPI